MTPQDLWPSANCTKPSFEPKIRSRKTKGGVISFFIPCYYFERFTHWVKFNSLVFLLGRVNFVVASASLVPMFRFDGFRRHTKIILVCRCPVLEA